jgi:bacteriocin biosynthesis cyclodehydratase domain-containing protein
VAKPKKLTYKLLPEWVIHQEENSLIISGGADARFEIELENSKPSFFSTLKNTTFFSRDELNEADLRVLEELVTAEIVVPRLQKNNTLRVAILGDDSKLAPIIDTNIKIVESNQDYDLALIIRTNSTYSDLLKDVDYQSIIKPHLLVDIAFHHTLSIGPLVFPAETACIACLQGRITTRWGDNTPPPKPLVATKYERVIPELIATELARIAKDDTSLTNKTVSWNFQERAIKKDQLLKVPICPVCTQNKIDQRGALALPWGKDESITNTV